MEVPETIPVEVVTAWNRLLWWYERGALVKTAQLFADSNENGERGCPLRRLPGTPGTRKSCCPLGGLAYFSRWGTDSATLIPFFGKEVANLMIQVGCFDDDEEEEVNQVNADAEAVMDWWDSQGAYNPSLLAKIFREFEKQVGEAGI